MLKILSSEMLSQIRQDPNSINWQILSNYYFLSEDFIREFADRVNWEYVSQRQLLSEEFIDEFAEFIDWKWVSGRFSWSEAFLDRHADKIHWGNFSWVHRDNVSYQIIIKHMFYICNIPPGALEVRVARNFSIIQKKDIYASYWITKESKDETS